jgi:hypothetical protein
VGCLRDMEGRLPGKDYYTHWMPRPPTYIVGPDSRRRI